MRINEIEARLAAIQTEIDGATGEQLTALENEVASLTAERNRLMDEAQARQKLRANVAAGLVGTTTETHGEATNMDNKQTFTLESEEYRSAFIKNLRREPLTEIEQRAFTFLTTNTTAPLPTAMQNHIIDLIGGSHPIVADVYTLNSNTAISIPVGKAIKADAGKSNEGAAANELQIEFADVTLSGEDFTANVVLSYKMLHMAIPAFEDYLVTMIAERLGAKLAGDIVTKIKAKINASNKIATGINYANICAGFGALKRVGKVLIYGTREAVFNKLVGMVDSNKRPIFQQPITAEAAGHLLGAVIKYEDALGATEVLIGDPSKYIQNVVERDKDLTNHKVVCSGYTLQEGTLTDDQAFALISEAAAG